MPLKIDIPHPLRAALAKFPDHTQVAIHAKLAELASEPHSLDHHRSIVVAGIDYILVAVAIPKEEKLAVISIRPDRGPWKR